MNPVGRRHHTVVDCREPETEAAFWSAVLGEPVTYRDADFVVVARSDLTSGLAFQRSPGYAAPRWPADDGDQQVHLDVMVDDVDAAARAVTALGATALDAGAHVDADPRGIRSASSRDRRGLHRSLTLR